VTWPSVARVVSIALAFGNNALLARLLMEDVGAFILIQTIAAAGTLLALRGIDKSMVRFVSQKLGEGDLARVPDTIRMSVRYSFPGIATILVSILIISSVDLLFINSIDGAVWAAAAVCFGANVLQMLGFAVLQALDRIEPALLFSIVLTPASTGCIYLLVLVNDIPVNMPQAVFVAALVTTMSAVAMVIVAVRAIPRVEPSAGGVRFSGSADLDENAFRSASRSLWLVGLVAIPISSADIWCAGTFFSPQKLSEYVLAAKFAVLVKTPSIVLSSIAPQLIAAHHGVNGAHSRSFLQIRIQEMTLKASLASASAFLVCLVFGEQLLGITFGPVYSSAAPVLWILSGAHLFSVLCGPASEILSMTGHHSTLVRIQFATASLALLAMPAAAISGSPTVLAVAFAVVAVSRAATTRYLANRLTGYGGVLERSEVDP
jgi:O-antigen/teichoic acid export membrane protein